MGRRGPKPKTNDQRLAPHASRELDTVAAEQVAQPPVNSGWADEAIEWYEGLALAPQAAEYTMSDWLEAKQGALALSRAVLLNDPVWFREWSKIADKLLTTRPSRLAARLDLDYATPTPDAEVVDLPTDEQLAQRMFG
ncbi:MAG: hypothetical protein F4Y14_00865 [Acidobacteria bacterium]|nr:hypothetical protein [Acidobacteriota bacterium]